MDGYFSTGCSATQVRIKPGDEVAIVPRPDSPPKDTIEIATVRSVGIIAVELLDYRMYTVNDRKALAPQVENYIVPATGAHRLFAGHRHLKTAMIGIRPVQLSCESPPAW